MAYCTPAQIRELIINIDPTNPSDSVINSLIAKADSEINSFCGNIYIIPFYPIPPFIETMSIEISAYYVFRMVYGNENPNYNEWIEKYERYIGTKKEPGILDKIHEGNLQIFDANGNEPPKAGSNIKSNNQDYRQTFNVDDPTNWSQDSNKLDDIANSREAS